VQPLTELQWVDGLTQNVALWKWLFVTDTLVRVTTVKGFIAQASLFYKILKGNQRSKLVGFEK
jgi:hypothetical protein